jgi:hypothetical protein
VSAYIYIFGGGEDEFTKRSTRFINRAGFTNGLEHMVHIDVMRKFQCLLSMFSMIRNHQVPVGRRGSGCGVA